MAVITQDTFNPLNAWISVRLQQGVPIVDADWNEADDMRRFELRAHLKWVAGDGVPEGNDGFRIDPPLVASPSNFRVRANVPPPVSATNFDTALRYAGRCFVDGLDVMIVSETLFTAQPLHPSQGGSAALAAAWGVPVIDTAPLTTSGVTTIAVYLDVWERLVTPAEAPSMILPALGIESCARRKREWVVRVAAGSAAPSPTIAGHSHYLLATITRPNAVPVNITASHITDRREKRLLLPPATLVADTVGGAAADYRKGIGRPLVSLREAINAVMRGEVPSTAASQVPAADSYEIFPRAVLDPSGAVVVAWTVSSAGFGQARVAVSRLNLLDPNATFGAPVMWGPASNDADSPSPVVLPDGDILVAFQHKTGGSTTYDVAFRRASTVGALGAAADQTVFATALVNDGPPAAVLAGDFVVFFARGALLGQLQYRRYNHTTSTFPEPGPTGTVSSTLTTSVHAAADATGQVWAAFDEPTGITVIRVDPVAGTFVTMSIWTAPSQGSYHAPFVLAAGSDVWVFWASDGEGIRFARHGSGSVVSGLAPYSAGGDQYVSAVALSDGRVMLAFTRIVPSFGYFGQYAAFIHPATLEWSPPVAIDVGANGAFGFTGVVAPDSSVFGVWTRRAGPFAVTAHLAYKRLAAPL